MNEPLRIGIVHYSCPPVVGGVEELIKQHALILHRLGHSVSILAGMGDQFTDQFPVKIEPVLGSMHPQVLKAHKECANANYSILRRLTDRILGILIEWGKNRDVLVVHNVLQMPFNLAFTLALRRYSMIPNAAPLVSWAHDSPFFQDSVPEYLNVAPWIVLKRPLPTINYITISESRRDLFSKHSEKIEWKVVPNGIDPATFFYLDPRSVMLAEELDLFNRDLVIVQPSRITPRKNLELSIHIVRGIKLLGYNVLYIMTGAYDPHEARAVSYYRRLRYWIKELDLMDNIAILAEYRFKDKTKLVPDRIFIRDLYLMADLLLMTSKDEGFGLPLLEAGIAKLPIACSEIPPFKEIGENVCFFRTEDPPMFTAGRIIQYLSSTSTHKMFRRVMTRYVLSSVCKDIMIPHLYEVASKRS